MGRNGSCDVIARACVLIALVLPSSAIAGRQGSIGATSTASVDINLSVAPRAQMSGLSDIDFSNADHAGNPMATRKICVWSNSHGGIYELDARGDGPRGSFTISNGEKSVGYSVLWASPGGPSVPETLASDKPSAQMKAAKTEAGCQRGEGYSRLLVAIDPAHLRTAELGRPLTGVLTFTVAPQ